VGASIASNSVKVLVTIGICLIVNGLTLAQEKSRYCMIVRDEMGATIPKPLIRFTPTKQSGSHVKYTFNGDSDGQIDVELIDTEYTIEVRAETFYKMVLKKQRHPSDPRSCIIVTLKTKIPPHQIT